MSEYNDLMYRLEVARAQLIIVSNQMTRHHSALMAMDEAMNAIDKTVAIVGRGAIRGQAYHSNKILSASQLPVSL